MDEEIGGFLGLAVGLGGGTDLTGCPPL